MNFFSGHKNKCKKQKEEVRFKKRELANWNPDWTACRKSLLNTE